MTGAITMETERRFLVLLICLLARNFSARVYRYFEYFSALSQHKRILCSTRSWRLFKAFSLLLSCFARLRHQSFRLKMEEKCQVPTRVKINWKEIFQAHTETFPLRCRWRETFPPLSHRLSLYANCLLMLPINEMWGEKKKMCWRQFDADNGESKLISINQFMRKKFQPNL